MLALYNTKIIYMYFINHIIILVLSKPRDKNTNHKKKIERFDRVLKKIVKTVIK